MGYRRPRAPSSGTILDLDSLMDILSCLVGVMLFLVIYTVLELGATAYQAEVLVSAEPALGADRVLVVCDGETVRVLDARGPLNELLSGFEIVETVAEVQTFVDAARRRPTDGYFQYSLGYTPRSTTELLGMVDLRVEGVPGVAGDSIQQLGPGSQYADALSRLDPNRVWLAFAVDSTSVDIFRRAREMAIERGFATGFDLLDLDFPLALPLSRAGVTDVLSPLNALSKPLR